MDASYGERQCPSPTLPTEATNPGSPDSVPDAEPEGAIPFLPLDLPFHRAVGDHLRSDAELSWSDRSPQLSNSSQVGISSVQVPVLLAPVTNPAL